ncbi:MAG: T9SS type A sorting domain-containing protein [Ignavibacteriaceae bacterium]
MKNYFRLLFVLVVIGFNPIVHTQVTLNPGADYMFSDNPANSGSSGDNGNLSFTYLNDYNLATKKLRAAVDGSVTSFGTGESVSSINYDFQISQTAGTNDNTVAALISYDASWQGFQLMLAIALSNSSVSVEMNLRDMTEGKLIYKDIIHELDLKTHSIKFVSIGLEYNDAGSRRNIFPAVLKRGHSYRLTLRLAATLQKYLATAAEVSSCNYFALNRGVELNELSIKVGLDEKETLQKLAKIDSLENKIDTLEYKLDNHYHTYLTGRGVGHNNTEAQTTLSIFDTENPGISPPVFPNNSQLKQIEDQSERSSIPDDFSLKQNHPNPFNPQTKISFDLPEQEFVSVKVYDVLGQLVATLINEIKTPGSHDVLFYAESLPSGTYIYEIRAGNYTEAKKMILLK